MAVEATRSLSNPAYHGYLLLRSGFVVAPILFGLDKFFNFTVRWPDYLAPWLKNILPVTAQQYMYFVGAVEIFAGILVLLAPRVGSLVVAAWLAGIIVNLLTAHPPQYYDIALRDFGLFLAVLALNRLATALDINTIRAELSPERRRPVVA